VKIATFAKRELAITFTTGQARAIGEFEDSGAWTAMWRWGRRSGKSLVGDVMCLFDAVTRDGLRSKLRAHEPRVSAIIAPRLEQSQEHVRNIAAMVQSSPRLRSLLVTQTSDELIFSNGSAIRAYPCSARSIRGGAWSSVVLDELGHYVTSEEGNAAGARVVEAALPSLAQFGASGWIIAISTPLWKSGAFWTLCQRAESGRFPYMHSLHATTAEMNQMIPAAWLEEQRRADPELYAREFEAQWIDGASSYLESSDVVACVRSGVDKLAAARGTAYVASLDPGYSIDSFAVAIGHRDSVGVAVIDGVWTWRKHGHERTLDAITELCRAYGLSRVTTDQHCAVPIIEGLARRSVLAVLSAWTNESKANAFAALKVALNTRAISLPDDPTLTEELCALEATPTPSGLTRISAISGSHDDRAVAIAAVIAQLVGTAATMTPEQVAAAGQLLEELRTPGGSRTAFADVIGVPGVPFLGYDRL
jgi:hypothetical protein